jgi:hypothetical protein
MAEELSQEDINKLLSSPGPKGGKKKALLEKFKANGKKFNNEIVNWLVRDLLGDKKKGHGLWWGGESCLSFRKLLEHQAKELQSGFEVSAVCEMEYQSSHIIYDENYEPHLQNARINMKLSPELEIESFDFK